MADDLITAPSTHESGIREIVDGLIGLWFSPDAFIEILNDAGYVIVPKSGPLDSDLIGRLRGAGKYGTGDNYLLPSDYEKLLFAILDLQADLRNLKSRNSPNTA